MTDWNERFLRLAINEVASWSKDPSTKVAAIVVDNLNYIRAISYNGFPKDIEDSDERLNDRSLKYKLTQHAERNALNTTSRLGIKTEGCKIIVTHFPCPECTGGIINAGINKIVTRTPTLGYFERWGDDIEISKMMIAEANIELIILDI